MSFKKIALRAFTEPVNPEVERTWKSKNFKPLYVLVIDTETTVDESQRLNFGSYRLLRIKWTKDGKIARVDCVKEGLFYADDLKERDPEGFAVLQNYALTHAADVMDDKTVYWKELLEVDPMLAFIPCSEFLNKLFYKWGYKPRLNSLGKKGKRVRAWVAGFNLPFDLSRLAVYAGEAQDKRFAGGFSLTLFDWFDKDTRQRKPNSNRPRLCIKNIDSKRSLKGFMRHPRPDTEDLIPQGETKPDEKHAFRGHFLDLRTLVFALTDKGHSLQSACDAFDVGYDKLQIEEHGMITPSYIDYNRQDVKLTAELFIKAIEEYYRHPIDLQPTKAYSPASVGKSYLRALNITPILRRQDDFPKEVLGYSMNAYFGGRAEVKVRRFPVPVVLTDFLSMYPTVNSLMELWRFQIAQRIEAVEDTENVRRFVESISLGDCFNPATWRQLPALVLVEPGGEPFPVRVKYDEHAQSWQIGVNELSSETPLWFTLPDVVAAKILSGKTPKVKRAIRLNPVGQLDGLKPVKLGGQIPVDPAGTDFFRKVIEERKSLGIRNLSGAERGRLDKFLKVLANSTSYGIFAETVRTELTGKHKESVKVYALDGETFEVSVSAIEKPGEFSFPPVAACITAAARMMLALLERLVTEMGGTYAFCDTDSMAIVASEQGGNVRLGKHSIKALSWEEVDLIVERFSSLNPYDKAIIPCSVLEIEKENKDKTTGNPRQLYSYAISAKRYALFNLDGSGMPDLRKVSEHGLGHLLTPTDLDQVLRKLDSGTDEDPSEGERKTPSWIDEIWNYIILTDGLKKKVDEPAWLDRPAMSRLAISSAAMRRPFKSYNNEKKSYQEQIKPFSFMLSAHVALFGHPEGVDKTHFHLVGRYNPDSKQWLKMKWLDIYSGKRYSVTTSGAASKGVARIKTYRDVLDDYRTHPEAKSLGPSGEVCDRKTKGLLKRRLITVMGIAYVGKESNRLEDVQAGFIHNEDEILNEYQDPGNTDFMNIILPVIQKIPVKRLTDESELSRRQIFYIRSGKKFPRDIERFVKIAARYAREYLESVGVEAQKDDYGAVFQYSRHSEIVKSP